MANPFAVVHADLFSALEQDPRGFYTSEPTRSLRLALLIAEDQTDVSNVDPGKPSFQHVLDYLRGLTNNDHAYDETLLPLVRKINAFNAGRA